MRAIGPKQLRRAVSSDGVDCIDQVQDRNQEWQEMALATCCSREPTIMEGSGIRTGEILGAGRLDFRFGRASR
jgi:hypothetical protein